MLAKGPESGNFCSGRVILVANKIDMLRNLGFHLIPVPLSNIGGDSPIEMIYIFLKITFTKYQDSMLNWILQFLNSELFINNDHLTPINKLSEINWGPYSELISQYSPKM